MRYSLIKYGSVLCGLQYQDRAAQAAIVTPIEKAW